MQRILLLLVLIFHSSFYAQTVQEQLGYDKNAKLLIIHADDIGVTHSENRGSIDAFKKEMVNSGSVMVPCPWFPEIASYARNNPNSDLGIHLTLTAEWKHYKWATVLPKTQASSLINDKGYMYAEPSDVVKKSRVKRG